MTRRQIGYVTELRVKKKIVLEGIEGFRWSFGYNIMSKRPMRVKKLAEEET